MTMLVPCLAALLAVAAAPDDADRATRWIMGTALTIDIPGAAASEEKAAARDAAFAEAQRWDDLLSHWRKDTPLSRLNASAGAGAVAVPKELFRYIQRALRDAERTNGLFDITVGGLLPPARRDAPPGAPASAPPLVGARHVRLEPPDRVGLPAGMALDPGGDGKGVALDAMVALLRSRGVDDAFLDFGGSSFYGLGEGRDGSGWVVALRGTDGEAAGVVRLRDASLSSSAALRTTAEGVVQAHVIDPRSGVLVRVPRAAFAVSPSATDAEVLSTALIVAPGDGPEIVPRFASAEALVFQTGRSAWSTPGFPREAVDEATGESP